MNHNVAERALIELESNLPNLLSTTIETLKNEGLFLGQESTEVKTSPLFEDKAIRAVNEAVREAAALSHSNGDCGRAARLLEKIQVAAAEAERAAYIVRTARAKICRELTHRIAMQSRSFFHELKAAGKQKIFPI